MQCQIGPPKSDYRMINAMKRGKPIGPFTKWINMGIEGWHPEDYETLEDALAADVYYTNFVITQPVKYEAKDPYD